MRSMVAAPERLTIEIETQERAYNSRDVFFKILFVVWGEKKKCRLIFLQQKIN